VRVAVIGGGVAGLAAAYDLTRAGHAVTIFEAEPEVGGLAAGFKDEAWDWSLEKFYHHWFRSDKDVVGLIGELGLADKVFWPRPVTAMWDDESRSEDALDSPIAALLYPGLSWPAKMRFGFVGLYLRFTPFWRPLEHHTADAWVSRWLGREAYEKLWLPLLIGKFGPYYDKVNMAWLWARLYKRSTRLGYFVGGFQAFLDALAERVVSQGAWLRLGAPVQQIKRDDGGFAVSVEGETLNFDAALSTTSPRLMARLAPDLPNAYRTQLEDLVSMGAVALILALRRQLVEKSYWLMPPATDPDRSRSKYPFINLVEHTNYISREHYGGDHIVYCGDYQPPDHEYFTLSKEKIMERFLPALSVFNPDFSPDWIRKSWLFRAPYAQPVPFVDHSRAIPDIRTGVPGLYFASMSQVYPWDRGTNYAVEIGRRAARLLLEDLG
jgi:protoporphyrinogen oxidase